jgi:hypothetical protein
MNVDYIKNLSEAYVIDNELYKEKITGDELFENFYGLIKDIRNNEPYLYKDLYESNKFEQQRIFKIYFDTIFKPENVFVEYKVEDLENLNEMLGEITFTTVQILSLLFVFQNRRPITKAVLGFITSIFDLLNSVGKTLSGLGETTRLAYSIIQSNSKKCYHECDFDPDNANPTDYMAQFRKGSITRNLGRMFQFDELAEDKTDCLRECYFHSVKEVVKLSAQTYFTCLKTTGDLSKLPLERDFSAYQNVLTNSGLSNSCDNLAENLKDAFKSFENVLDLIYDDKPVEMKKQRYELMMDIYNMQKSLSGGGSSGNYQVKSFPQRPALPDKPKFQQNFNKPKQQF